MVKLEKALSNNVAALGVVILSISCSAVSEQPKKQLLQADSTINAKLRLEDYSSIKKIGVNAKQLQAVESLRESPVICFLNRNKTEYLLAYQYDGDSKNAFACFEIGYTSALTVPKHSVSVPIGHFNTETGIGLGMPISQLIKLKGQPTKIDKDGTVNYSLDASSSFVKRYRMPGYFFQCKIEDAKLSSIKFGFDYP